MKSFAALALGLQAVAAKVSYDGYKVFHIETSDFEATQAKLSGIEYVSLDCESDHKSLEVAVSPQDLKAFEALGLDVEVSIEDMGAEIAKEGEMKPYKARKKARDVCTGLPDMSYFDSYHIFEEHLDFLEDLQSAFVRNSELFDAGESLEGRPLKGIHLWGRDGPGIKPAIIWHGTVHAREWITAPSVEYMAYQIIRDYRIKEPLITETLDNYDFYIMPVVNPDGFVHTHEVDRLWRKNRQARESSTCIGTDVNRNWPHQWDVPGGSSPDPCSQTYRGEAPGDTPEMAVLTNHTLSIAEATGIKFYVDWHSYSQLILLPYGYSCDAVVEDLDSQMELARGVHDAIKSVNGLDFVYGPTCQTIYQTSGGSMDYVYDVADAEVSWAFELRPQTQREGGFVIPPENIIPSGEEVWAGMRNLFANF
ncbi:carboxypeptidase A4 [Emericellopsis atlantica]|uniref:Carboxypeptidase A4 n=1 Tax=Emericellopsis atlantica TaxID=2614577 RepID=A0A9P8CTG1_9HYPO|nr:carboxypeptidase A4 [Emericellopsis atlantica]KAG9256786.1 carboxypeptidase A4 [Emericellopsis atlantica]